MIRIMRDKKIEKVVTHAESECRDQVAAWAIAFLVRNGEIEQAKRMMREWGFKDIGDLHAIDPYDMKALIALLEKEPSKENNIIYFGSVNVHSSIECFCIAAKKEEAEQKMIDFAQDHEHLAELDEVEAGRISIWDEKTMPDLAGRPGWFNIDSFDDENRI